MVEGEGILTRPDGAALVYRRGPGRAPGVIFLHGFRSDMTGGKALAVEAWCRAQGRACLLFDGFAHGRSSGDFAQATIGRWAEDAAAVIDALTEGPQVIVGSSMGGWLMLLAALRRPERVAGLLGLAAAPDFTEELMWAEMPFETRREIMECGQTMMPGTYDLPPCPLTRRLIEEGREHLLLGGPIAITCPVRLIHGLADPDVPWRTALRLQEQLESNDVEVTLVKGGGHRLSEPHDLARMLTALEGLVG